MAYLQGEIVQIEPGGNLSELVTPARSTLWHKLALGGIMLISIFMNFFHLGPPVILSVSEESHATGTEILRLRSE